MPKVYRMVADPPCAIYPPLEGVVRWRASGADGVLCEYELPVRTEAHGELVHVYPTERTGVGFEEETVVHTIEVQWGDMELWVESASFPDGLTVPTDQTLNMFPDRHLLAVHERMFRRGTL